MDGASRSQGVAVSAGDVVLAGDLSLPADPLGLVVFAHGSGSSRLSERNRHVARVLQRAGLGTLLFDLLTADEEHVDRHTREYRFDLPLLARRLVGVVDWCRSQEDTAGLPLGCFGASTGAGAALMAAAQRPESIAAVVARGGRPDLVGQDLPTVRAPTLLVVGGEDVQVVQLNRQAMKRMDEQVDVELILVPNAGRLFDEPGALDAVADLAATWFRRHLAHVVA